jgi:drug/metabolite transporter (DMT)-like permease
MKTDLLLSIGTVLIWGSTWFAIKFQLGKVSPEVSVVYRFAIASLILFGWCWIRKLKLRFTLRDHLLMMLQGLFLFSLNYQLAYFATQYLTSGINAVVFSTILIFNLMNSAIVYKIRITLLAAVAAVLGLTGIVIVFSSEFATLDLSSGPIFGFICSLGGALIASCGNMISLRHSKRSLPVTETNAFAMGYGALLTFIFLVLRGKSFSFDLSPSYVGSLLYLSIFGSIFAFGCYLKLLGRIGAHRAAYPLLLTPVVALGISTLFEHYVWSAHAVFGVFLIFVGNGLILLRRKATT